MKQLQLCAFVPLCLPKLIYNDRSFLIYRLICLVLILFTTFTLYGCMQNQPQDQKINNTNLTYGEVNSFIQEGKTTQGDILQKFGSPNLMTKDADGNEVWSYNKMSFQTKADGSYGSLILIGGSNVSKTSTSASFDLIVSFNKDKIVKTYKVISATY